jgi:hypothetical protein
MRVSLSVQSAAPPFLSAEAVPLSVTIRSACGVPREYVCVTDSKAFLSMLSLKTNVPPSRLRRFEDTLYYSSKARLPGVELSDQFLVEIGYLVDMEIPLGGSAYWVN